MLEGTEVNIHRKWTTARKFSADIPPWIALNRCNRCAALPSAPPRRPFPPRCDPECDRCHSCRRTAQCIRCSPATRHTHNEPCLRSCSATNLPGGWAEQRDPLSKPPQQPRHSPHSTP